MPVSPEHPDFWNSRYSAGRMPWDAAGVPAPLARYLKANPGNGARVLIPGCGTGREIRAFVDAGYRVTAIDFSAEAVHRARANVGPAIADSIVEGDFFTCDVGAAPFDFVYERTFVCALPSADWPRIVERTARLLTPGGTWFGIFFFGAKDDGPPFGLADDEPARLFDPHFVTVRNEPIAPGESLPLFAGGERWQERRRREHPAAGLAPV